MDGVEDDAECASALLACVEMIGNGMRCFISTGTAYGRAGKHVADVRIGSCALQVPAAPCADRLCALRKMS